MHGGDGPKPSFAGARVRFSGMRTRFALSASPSRSTDTQQAQIKASTIARHWRDGSGSAHNSITHAPAGVVGKRRRHYRIDAEPAARGLEDVGAWIFWEEHVQPNSWALAGQKGWLGFHVPHLHRLHGTCPLSFERVRRQTRCAHKSSHRRQNGESQLDVICWVDDGAGGATGVNAPSPLL